MKKNRNMEIVSIQEDQYVSYCNFMALFQSNMATPRAGGVIRAVVRMSAGTDPNGTHFSLSRALYPYLHIWLMRAHQKNRKQQVKQKPCHRALTRKVVQNAILFGQVLSQIHTFSQFQIIEFQYDVLMILLGSISYL